MKIDKIILFLFVFIILLNISFSQDILFFKETFSKNQTLTIDYIIDNTKESVLNSNNLFYSDNTFYTGKSVSSTSNPSISTTGGYQVFNTPSDSVGRIFYDFGENITILNNSYFIFNSSGFNDDPTARPASLHIRFYDDGDSFLAVLETYYIHLKNGYLINMSSLNGQKFRFISLNLGSTNSFSNYHNLNNLELYNFRRPLNPNNTLPYIESITPLNRNIELCGDFVNFNYTINAIDDENDIIYYSSTKPLIYNKKVAIESNFAEYINPNCFLDNTFINSYLNIDKSGYYRQGLLNSEDCKGYIQGFENLSFNYDVGVFGNSTFRIDLNYINGLFANNNNNVSICVYDETNFLIDCYEYQKIENNISIYNSNNNLMVTLENFKTNNFLINFFNFYPNESRINLSFTYINTSNNVKSLSYNYSKEVNNIKGFNIQTKDFNRFLSEDLQIQRINLLGTEIIPELTFDTNKNRIAEFTTFGAQSISLYITDEQGLNLNQYVNENLNINVVPCGSLLNPYNQTQEYKGQTLNIFEGLGEFKTMIKLFFNSFDTIFGIENNFFNIYWAFKTLSFIVSLALCVAISTLFINFGVKIVYFIFSVFLTLTYFFNTLLIEYSINFTMIIILNMILALIQLVAMKGGDSIQ